MLDKEKVALWYRQALWNETMVQNAVKKGKLSKDDVTEILANKTNPATARFNK